MAAKIPDHFIGELLTRVDIVEVIGERLELKRVGSNLQALCPFHSEKTPSFTVSPSKQFYHCFGCGAHGTAIRFLMEHDRLGFRDAVETLAQRAGMALPEEARDEREEQYGELYKLLGKASQHYQRWLREHPERETAVAYLKRRGLSGDIAAQYGLGFAPPGWDNLARALGRSPKLVIAGLANERDNGGLYDRFRERIIFPIRDRRGRVIGFGGRVLGEGQPKYLNSPETPVFHKGRELYGLYECLKKQRHPDAIVVVEGYMDVVALAQYGISEAVATLGTATSTTQVDRLFQVTKDVVFCFDGDRAGRQAAWRALENALPAMRSGRQARFLFLPDGEDPDSLVRKEGAENFRHRMAKAAQLSEFFFDNLSREVDLGSMDGRARLAERAAPHLKKLPPGLLRDMMFQRLSEITGLQTERLEAGISGARNAAPRQAKGQKPRGPRLERTPARVAIAMLLQQPQLARLATETEGYREQDNPGIELLGQMLELLNAEPQLSTGALLERFRDSRHESALWKLATWEHMVPDDGLEREFTDALRRIEGLIAPKRLQYLDKRMQQGQLTESELQEWQQLLREWKETKARATDPPTE
ncbi:DNA primase [Alkalilimnicola ehrlichii]|uniref:DNA primase n=3 Tax=Alkalilimnicola ehrlichii TaxID=351052 RepID=A0A3E0WZS3_9GAMM|nr:DNA primase [Alkalilimnicola ehrlichii]